MIREIKGYFWGNADVPIKKDDHSMDELRYYIMNKPQSKELKTEKSLDFSAKLDYSQETVEFTGTPVLIDKRVFK